MRADVSARMRKRHLQEMLGAIYGEVESEEEPEEEYDPEHENVEFYLEKCDYKKKLSLIKQEDLTSFIYSIVEIYDERYFPNFHKYLVYIRDEVVSPRDRYNIDVLHPYIVSFKDYYREKLENSDTDDERHDGNGIFTDVYDFTDPVRFGDPHDDTSETEKNKQ